MQLISGCTSFVRNNNGRYLCNKRIFTLAEIIMFGKRYG